MPLIFVVLSLSFLDLALAPPPRCKVQGYFQVPLLIFACDGASGYPGDNQVETMIAPRSSFMQEIPQGTRNLIVTADSPTGIDATLMDPLSLTAIKGPTYKGVPFTIAGAGQHKEIRLSGTSPN